ncbi:MAG TPA: hypothetical protein K8W04_13800, partial [Bacteroides reticulotermitis]|nr:hypothetical protein [Bacteroides reticulotermitis]
MKKYKLILLACLSVCVYCGCVEDKGNYDYIELNDMTIQPLEKAYIVELFSQVKITPEITLKTGEFNPDDYTYVWMLYTIFADPFTADTLSREKDLDIEISALPRTYKLYYEVKHKESELICTQLTDFTVINSYSIGLMALSRVNDDANLTFINVLDQVTEDTYEKLNGEIAGKNPKGIRLIGNSMLSDATPTVMIMTDDERGGVVINSQDLVYVQDFSDMFYFKLEHSRPQAFMTNDFTFIELVINDGAIYKREVMMVEDPYPKFGVKLKGDYEYMAPFEFYGPIVAYFYDQVKQRFMYMPAPMQGNSIIELNDIATEEPEPIEGEEPGKVVIGEFNPNDVGLNMLWGGLFGMEHQKQNGRSVMEDEEGERYMLSFEATPGPEFMPLHKFHVTSEGIKEARAFTTPQGGQFLYYAYSNKIVCVSFSSGMVVNIYEFADGQQVDYVECDQKNNINHLWVGVSDGSKAKKSGSIVIMDMSTDGSLKEVTRYKNVCGQIVDFEYKE